MGGGLGEAGMGPGRGDGGWQSWGTPSGVSSVHLIAYLSFVLVSVTNCRITEFPLYESLN